MKLVLVFFAFACFLQLTSAFWFNVRTNEPTKALTTSSTTRRPTYPLQQAPNQLRNQLQNQAISHRQLPITTRKSSANPSPPQRILNSLQNQRRNTTAGQHPINRNTSPVIVRNRFPAVLYKTQQQQRVPLLNHSLSTRRVMNRIPNNTPRQVIFGRFPPRVSTQKVNAVIVTMSNRRSIPHLTSSSKAKSLPTVKANPPRFLYVRGTTPVPNRPLIPHLTSSSKAKSLPTVKAIPPRFLYVKGTTSAPNRPLIQHLTTASKAKILPTVKANPQQFSYAKGITPTPRTSLFRTLTTRAAAMNRIENRQHLLDQYNREEQWRAFQQYWNKRTPVQHPLKANSALRRRKREDPSQDDSYPMIFARYGIFTEEQ